MKIKKIPLALDNMMDDDVGIVVELSLLLTSRRKFVLFSILYVHLKKNMKEKMKIVCSL